MNHIINDSPTRIAGRFGRLSYLAWLLVSTLIFFVLLAIFMRLTGLGTNSASLAHLSILPLGIMTILYLVFILDLW